MFRLAYQISPFEAQITYKDKLFFIGSCFTENMYERFSALKFNCLQNPHGILFNPISILQVVEDYAVQKIYTETDLIYLNETYRSWKHHDKFWGNTAQDCLHLINTSLQHTYQFLPQADWAFVTLGSAWVYELLEKQQVVTNCHRAPHSWFNRYLLKITTIQDALQQIIDLLRTIQPTIKIVFTISPVRHIREGFVENNRSKAALITSVHEVIAQNEQVFYFPSYELVIDDLRDYRFFIEDMVHPNRLATTYIWEKLSESLVEKETLTLMKEVDKIVKALHYQPTNPHSEAHRQFLRASLEKTKKLKSELSFLDWEKEIAYFQGE